MQKLWETPQIRLQQFEANESISACSSDGEITYTFTCDAGYDDRIYSIIGPNGNMTSISGFWEYERCGTSHSVKKSDVIEGYSIRNQTGGEPIPVVIWTDGGSEVHCTTNLVVSSWEKTHS